MSNMTGISEHEEVAGVECTQIDFMTFPGEIRNIIYDMITFERMHVFHQQKLKTNDPLPVPMTDELLELRHVSHQFSREIFNRFFTWGATLRLNMVPQWPKAINVRMETEVTRKHLCGTCPTGTSNVAYEYAMRLRPYRALGAIVIPSVYAEAWKTVKFELLFRCCSYNERCNACQCLQWEREKFDIMPTLANLTGWHYYALPNAPLLDIVITQEENWLAFGGKRLLEIGDVGDFVASSEGTNGNELEWHLQTAW